MFAFKLPLAPEPSVYPPILNAPVNPDATLKLLILIDEALGYKYFIQLVVQVNFFIIFTKILRNEKVNLQPRKT